MDINFFYDLDEIISQTGPSSLTQEKKEEAAAQPFDYDLFKYDFSRSCKMIRILAQIEPTQYSKECLVFSKHIFILTSFLKNRNSIKISHVDELALLKTTNILETRIRSQDFRSLPDVNLNIVHTCRCFLALSLALIHELVGISSTLPRNRAAVPYFTYEMANSDGAVVSCIASSFKDSDFIGEILDEITSSAVFRKYCIESVPIYKSAIESSILVKFGIICLVSILLLTLITEICIKNF